MRAKPSRTSIERAAEASVLLSEGGHQMSLEKNRMHLIGEVQHFLEEPLTQ
jgi:hypothetical protein